MSSGSGPKRPVCGIYLPIGHDEAKRLFYTADHLAWVGASSWDQFLSAYWGAKGSVAASTWQVGEMPVCNSTRDCRALLPLQLPVLLVKVYLPFITHLPKSIDDVFRPQIP